MYVNRKGILNIVIIVFVMFSVCSVFMAEPSNAATVKTIPSKSTIVAKANKLKLSKSNYKATWSGVSHKVKTGAGKEKIFCVPIKNTSSSWTIKNFLTLTFTNVGVINGRQIDCKVKVDALTVTARKGSSDGETSDGYMGVCSLWDVDEGLQFGITIKDGCGYRALKTVTYTSTVYYNDTGKTVELPFFQAVRDLDASESYFTEAWEGGAGYTGTYYKYSTNYNTFSGNKVLAPTKNELTSGDDEILKSGIYATTSGGSFTAKFYDGNCGTMLNLYSQYTSTPSVFSVPQKSVDTTRAKPGETVKYTISHKMGVFYKTAMSVYGKLEFNDVIPAGLEYKSAKLTNGSGTDITSSGTISYDDDTKALKFTMGDKWRTNVSNYNGQKINLLITTEVTDFDGEKMNASNTANISYESDLSYDTNTVNTELVKDPEIQIVMKTKDNADEFTEAHGNVTFLFRITAKNSGKVWYRSFTYGNANASDGWSFKKEDGYRVATSTREKFPEDEYTVAAVDVSRFRITNIDTVKEDNLTTYIFEADKTTWQYLNHNFVIINKLAGGAANE